MTAAALTPRVRILVVCDEVTPSEIEDGVFTLAGVRQRLYVEFFRADAIFTCSYCCPARAKEDTKARSGS